MDAAYSIRPSYVLTKAMLTPGLYQIYLSNGINLKISEIISCSRDQKWMDVKLTEDFLLDEHFFKKKSNNIVSINVDHIVAMFEYDP